MNAYIDICPLVCRLKRTTTFRLSTYSDMRRPTSGSRVGVSVNRVNDFREHRHYSPVVSADGTIEFRFEAVQPGEYIVSIYRDGAGWSTDTGARVSFYAVPDELAGLFPYRGDLHMHSTYSDGSRSVEYMVARGRETGLDFMALTDHRVFSASVEAEEWSRDVGAPMAIIRGEEINFPLGIGHIVALDTDRPVSDRFDMHETDSPKSTAEAKRQVELMVDQMRPLYGRDVDAIDLGDAVDRDLFLWSYGVAQEIRAAGGLPVIAHPYWRSRGVLDLVASTYDAVLEHDVFDAVEVINGSGVEGMMLALAKAVEHGWLEGQMPGFLGSSDAHRPESLGSRYTIAFAPELSVAAILDTIRRNRTVACAVGALPAPVIVGSYPLVEYAYFLTREFFPLHDDLCASQGALYKVNAPDSRTGTSGRTTDEVPPITGAVAETTDAADRIQSRLNALYRDHFAF